MEGIIFHSEKLSSWALPVVLLAKSHTDASNSYWKNVLQMCEITVNVSNINYKTETCHPPQKKKNNIWMSLYYFLIYNQLQELKRFFFHVKWCQIPFNILSCSSTHWFKHVLRHNAQYCEQKPQYFQDILLWLILSNYDQSAFITIRKPSEILVIKTKWIVIVRLYMPFSICTKKQNYLINNNNNKW